MGAFAAAQELPVVPGSWTEVTDQPYENDDPDYRDPVWSNSGAGWGLVSGRSTAIAVDGDPQLGNHFVEHPRELLHIVGPVAVVLL